MTTAFDKAPNTRLTDLLYTRQTQQFSQRIEQSKVFESIKYTLGATLSCGQFLDSSISAKLEEFLTFYEKMDSQGQLTSPSFIRFDPAIFEKTLDHFSVVTRDEWNLHIGTLRDSNSDIAYQTPMEKSQGKPRVFTDSFMPLLNQEALASCRVIEETFGAVAEEEIPKDAFIAFSQKRWPSYICPQACEDFSAKAEAELDTLMADLNESNQSLENLHLDIQYPEVSLPAGVPPVVGRCVGCHSEKDRNLQIGPYIPFTDSEKIVEWSLLIEESTAALRPELRNGGRRMPLGQRSLSTSERAQLINYTRGL